MSPPTMYKGSKKASTVVMLSQISGDDSTISMPNNEPEQIHNIEKRVNKTRSILNYLKIRNHYLRCFVAELFATWLFLTIGFSSVARHDLTNQASSFSITLSFAIGCGIAILIVGKVSGAHVNPAVSLSVLLSGQLKPALFLVYIVAQLLGSFLAAITVFLVYFDCFDSHPNGIFSVDTLKVFISHHHESINIPIALFESTLATSLLIWPLQALGDKRNEQHPFGIKIILIVLILVAIPLALGHHAGLFINPVADLGPRLFALVVGWGSQAFSSNHYFFWIPLVGPMLGSAFAVLTYNLIISNNW